MKKKNLKKFVFLIFDMVNSFMEKYRDLIYWEEIYRKLFVVV